VCATPGPCAKTIIQLSQLQLHVLSLCCRTAPTVAKVLSFLLAMLTSHSSGNKSSMSPTSDIGASAIMLLCEHQQDRRPGVRGRAFCRRTTSLVPCMGVAHGCCTWVWHALPDTGQLQRCSIPNRKP